MLFSKSYIKRIMSLKIDSPLLNSSYCYWIVQYLLNAHIVVIIVLLPHYGKENENGSIDFQEVQLKLLFYFFFI